jgi:uncharacterized membrane protein HdeD (DUF308 family)
VSKEEVQEMSQELIRRWWVVALRGAISVLLGVDLLMEPIGTLWVLVSAFGLLALADGLFALGVGLRVGWLAAFLDGVIGIVIGVFTFMYPEAVEVWFFGFVAAWAVVMGGLGLTGAVGLRRRKMNGSWLLGLHGLTSLVFGMVLVLESDLGGLPAVFGVYAAASGALLVALAFRIRGSAVFMTPSVSSR